MVEGGEDVLDDCDSCADTAATSIECKSASAKELDVCVVEGRLSLAKARGEVVADSAARPVASDGKGE